MPESLSDRLRSLGMQVGTRNLRPPARPIKGFPISDILPGRFTETPLGQAFIYEQDYPADYRHGSVCFADPVNLEMLCQWGQSPSLAQRPITDFLFLDTETSGLAGGSGTFVFLIGLGFWTASGFRLVQLFMEEPVHEPALMSVLTSIVDPFPAIVTFNGKSFDVPILNTRHILNGLTSPFPEKDHLDLLMLARRLWRNRLPSRSLGSLEVDILGLGRTSDEIPGWMIPQLYMDYLRSRDARPLSGVFYHNAMDILSLAALFSHTARLLTNPLVVDHPESLDVIAIARMHEDLGHLQEAVQMYESGIQMGLPDHFLLDTFMRFATLYRKNGSWPDAVALWEKAAGLNAVEPCIELAKYYEHQTRQCELALAWTERANELVARSRMGVWQQRTLQAELAHRAQRLHKKLAGMAATPGEED